MNITNARDGRDSCLNDHQGDAIAFLYGHVREFDVESGRH
jgi:hypothetical protein